METVKVRIEVTKDDIESSKGCESENCAVANAMKRAFTDMGVYHEDLSVCREDRKNFVSVQKDQILFALGDGRLLQKHSPSQELRNFITHFDLHKKSQHACNAPKPFSFEVDAVIEPNGVDNVQ